MEPSNDDNLLEVVAVLGATQMVSRSIGLRNGIYTKRMIRILYVYFIANCKLLFYKMLTEKFFTDVGPVLPCQKYGGVCVTGLAVR